jgi:hypothetical protein
VREERRAAQRVLESLEKSPLFEDRFTIRVVSWDDPDAPATMDARRSPQDSVNRALPKPSECDIAVVILLWGAWGPPSQYDAECFSVVGGDTIASIVSCDETRSDAASIASATLPARSPD